MYPGDNRLDFEAVMQQNVGTAGGILVPEQLSREIIGYLRNISVIRGHVRSLQFKGSMVIPSVEQGTTASYLSEIADDNAQDLTLGQHRLTERKLRALVAVSNDLLRNSDPGADAAVRDDLANALAEGENLAFIRGQGLNNSPKGLRYWALAANVNDGHRQHRGHHRGGHRQHGREVHLRDAGQAKRAALDHAEQKLLSAIQSAP
jgi:HK97 family phage major capsid protein